MMATSSVCRTCLRTLRQQARKELQYRKPSSPSSIFRPQHVARPLSSSTRSLATEERSTRPPPPETNAPPANFADLASRLRQSFALRGTTEPYIAYGSTEDLFRACAAQCSYTVPNLLKTPPEPAPKNAAQEDVGVGEGWWVAPKTQAGLGLDVTFNTWAQVLFLHMYMLTVRLRMFPAEHAKIWHQNLLDHFFYAAEDRMAVWHGMSARGVRNKYLKDLWLQWRGLLLSYDEGLIKGDAVLGTAVWRNMFKGREEVDVADVGLVTAYMRRELARLGKLSDQELAEGNVVFQSPETLKAVMGKVSPWMQKPFSGTEGIKDVQ